MLRSSLPLLSDSYKEFSTLLLSKIKSSKTAIELQSTIKEIIVRESKIDMQKVPKFVKQQVETNPKYAQKYIDGRRISVVNTLLTQCQVNKMWQQSIVVFTTAISMQVPIKPSWEKMVFNAAPDVRAKSQVASRLKQHGYMPSSFSGNEGTFLHSSSHHQRTNTTRDDSSSSAARRDDEDNNDNVNNNASSQDNTNDSDQPTTEIKKVVVGNDFFTNNNNKNSTSQLQLSTSSTNLSQQHTNIAHISTNTLFDNYYLKQGLVKNGTELALLTSALKKRPITCFRVNLSYPGWETVAATAMNLPYVEIVPWYNKNFHHQSTSSSFPVAFQIDMDHSRRLMNRHQQNNSNHRWSSTSDKFHTHETEIKRSRDWIKKMSEEGLISIQSPSSLFVGSLVDPSPSDAVLDLCAAPGSKSRQMLDAMILNITGNNNSGSEGNIISPSGVVVSNEASASRHHLLSHLLCTNGRMPHTAITRSQGEKYSVFSRVGSWDKILVDAPCSGEGMLHKFPSDWASWTPMRGVQHHQTQLALLKRAIDLTRVGGKVVYSTCTLNPLENEAVVAAALNYQNRFATSDDEVVCELEEIPRNDLTRLKNSITAERNYDEDDIDNGSKKYSSFMSRGMNEWMVPIQRENQPFGFVSSSSETVPNLLIEEGKSREKKFPGSASSSSSSSLSKNVPLTVFNTTSNMMIARNQNENNNRSHHNQWNQNLHRCLRITPMNNSGFDAFFCAIIRKKRASPRSNLTTTTFSLSHNSNSSSSSSYFAKTNATALNESKRLKSGNEQADPIISSIVHNFFGDDTTTTVSTLLNQGQKYVLEQRSFSLTAKEEQELLMNGEDDDFRLQSSLSHSSKNHQDEKMMLVKSTSQKPLSLRVLSEKSWNIATDETTGGTVQVVCPGNVFAHVSYYHYSHNNKQIQTKWKLTHHGANLIGKLGMMTMMMMSSAASSTSHNNGINNRSITNLQNFVTGVPANILKMILSTVHGKIENVREELLTDDILKMTNREQEDDATNQEEDDDSITASQVERKSRAKWQQDLTSILLSSKNHQQQNQQIILQSSIAGSFVFIPCEIVIATSSLQCHLDANERKKLLLLMAQLSALPRKVDASLSNHEQRKQQNPRHLRLKQQTSENRFKKDRSTSRAVPQHQQQQEIFEL